MRVRRLVGVALLGGLVTVGIDASQTPPPQDPQPRFTTATTAITVDVVVRGRDGRPVTDLRREDFELYEEGVQQEIGDVVFVAPPPPRASKVAPSAQQIANGDVPAPKPDDRTTITNPTFLAILFDRLSPEAKSLAYRGASSYLDTVHPDDFVGVYVSDLSLRTIQTYTNDRKKLDAAFTRAVSLASPVFGAVSTQSVTQSRGSPSIGETTSTDAVASAEFAGLSGATAGFNPALAGAEAIGQQTWDHLEREQQGYASTNALLALVTALGSLPGRKSVVYFSEGVSLPDKIVPQFDNVIATANRANVTIYAIDAGGLRISSDLRGVAADLNAYGASRMAALESGNDRGGSLLQAFEGFQEVMRSTAHASLSNLTKPTGGFLIENTNDLGKAFRRVDDDRRSYYLLTYTPRNTTFNGEWRRLEVRVPTRRVDVRGRSGYVAVRTPAGIPVLKYQAPALAALEQQPAPHDLDIRASTFIFPAAAKKTLVPILLVAPARVLQFDLGPHSYHADFTMVARVLDTKGEIVRMASQPYTLTGNRTDLDRIRSGSILFYRQPELPPGHYTLEGVIYDTVGKHAGVVREPLDVPATTATTADASPLRVSSLILVTAAEHVDATNHADDNPFYLGDVLLYPNLGEPIRRGTPAEGRKLAFYLQIDAGPNDHPTGLFEMRRQDADADIVVAHAPMTLGPADAGGRIQHVGRFPLQDLRPGSYVVRVTVSARGHDERREAPLRIVE